MSIDKMTAPQLREYIAILEDALPGSRSPETFVSTICRRRLADARARLEEHERETMAVYLDMFD